MTEEPQNSVPKSTALTVLKAKGIAVAETRGQVVLSQGDIIEVHELPDLVHRRMLRRFAVKFGIPIHLFFRPELLPKQQQ